MSSNKTIAKNTLVLYGRMFFNMAVSLYTSRVVLEVLGVTDFGIYNLVGGVVVLFSFLNGAMSTATQRFLNIEIAGGHRPRIRSVFSMSLNIHLLICLVVLFLAETVGLWFLNDRLIIPADRLHAANWVYQLSVLTTLIQIAKVPFNAIILAKERMSFYAFMGIAETSLRLLIVISLPHFINTDPLITYSSLVFVLSIISALAFFVFCRRKFSIETVYSFEKDRNLFLKLTSFSSWSLMGQVSVLSANQGVNMLLNLFFGVVVNAALGIANQVNGAIYAFVSNAQVAFNQQITQSYASGRYDRHVTLVLQASRFSFYLMMIVAAPILMSTDFILNIWLGGNVPKYAADFTRIIVLSSLISAIAGPFWMSAYAVGDIRNYQLIISAIVILNLPIAYILLHLNYAPTSIIALKLFLDTIVLIFRFFYFKTSLNLKIAVIKTTVFRILSLFMVVICVLIGAQIFEVKDIVGFLRNSVILELILLGCIFSIGLTKNESHKVINYLKIKLQAYDR